MLQMEKFASTLPNYELCVTDDPFYALALINGVLFLRKVILLAEYTHGLYSGIQLIEHASKRVFPIASILVHTNWNDEIFARARTAGADWCFANLKTRDLFREELKATICSSAERHMQKELLTLLDPRTSQPDRDIYVYNDRGAWAWFQYHWNDIAKNGGYISSISLDLKGFGAANEETHLDGNRLLKEVAEVLCLGVRPEDMVFRDAGDKFTIMFANSSKFEVKEVAERLKEAVEAHPFRLSSGKLFSVTFRYGVFSTNPVQDAGKPAEEMYERVNNEADRAERYKKMREVKASLI